MRSPCDLAGWSFFILIVVATYTAVLTADLTAENLARPYLSTVEDITAAGHTICAQSIFQSFLILRWPTTSFLWLDYPDVGIDELERGDCFALLQSHSWDLYYISATNLASSLCRLGYGIPPGGENALLIPKAYPISSQYQAAFSSLVESLALRHVTPGTYEAAYSSNNCTFAISGEITPQTSLTFELKQMCAPFSILAGCVLIGFCSHLTRACSSDSKALCSCRTRHSGFSQTASDAQSQHCGQQNVGHSARDGRGRLERARQRARARCMNVWVYRAVAL